MNAFIFGIVGTIVLLVVVIVIVLKFLKPQRTGSVKSIMASIKDGIKVEFHPPQLYLDGLPDLPKKHPIKKEFDDGVLAMDKKKWNEAIGIFRKLLPKAKRNQKVALLNLIGICFCNQSEFDQALTHYQESLELAEKIQDKKGIIVNLNNRGLVYAKKKDYNTAIRNFTKAIEIDSNDAKAMANMGLAYKKKGDEKSARIWWEKALEKQEYLPDSAEEMVKQWLKEL